MSVGYSDDRTNVLYDLYFTLDNSNVKYNLKSKVLKYGLLITVNDGIERKREK